MPELKAKYPYYLNNEAVFANDDLEVTDKYSGEVATRCALADSAAIDAGIAGAVEATDAMAKMPSFAKKAVLEHCVARFRERKEELAYSLCVEAGKPINDAEGEVTRLIDTFQIAAEESTRMHGELQALDISPRAKGYRGMWKRVPIGPCSFISPFNFPLNLAAHKVAPAIAVGCPFVMKPASRTPLGALIMGEVLAETDLPKGAFSILPCSRDGADLFTVDDRLKLLSFTGSPGVGWDLKARCGKKKVVLELGGNAAVVVDSDTRDLDDAVTRIIFGAFYQSGQSCIGVQRIIIHEDIYDEMKAKLVAKTKTLVSGDPKVRETFIGPMISEKEAARLHGWIESAVAAGGDLLCGGGATARCCRRRCWRTCRWIRTFAPRRPSARPLSCRNSRPGIRRSRWSTIPSSACRRASSPAITTRCSRRGMRWTWAGSLSAMFRPIGSTTCHTGASRIAGSGAKASCSRWRT